MKLLVRLCHVATVDFRKSERTNFYALAPTVRAKLKPGDAVAFRNSSGNQVCFVLAPTHVNRQDGILLEVTSSIRLRLPPNRLWNPLMLADYASAAGLELIGLRSLTKTLKPWGGRVTTTKVQKKRAKRTK